MIYIEEELLKDDPELTSTLKDEFRSVKNFEGLNYSASDIFMKKRKIPFLVPYNYGRGITGKNEYVLRWGNGCRFNCIYCYMRQKPGFDKRMTLFADINQIKEEVDRLTEIKNGFIINAGENFDSFIPEEMTGFTTRLTGLFSKYPQITVEYRTKSLIPEKYIDHVRSDNTFIAISLNPETINTSFEKGTAKFGDRLINLRKLLNKGHRVALRIEPVILTETFPKNYFNFIERLNNEIDLNRLESIDISLLRLTKKGLSSLKNIKDIMRAEWILSDILSDNG